MCGIGGIVSRSGSQISRLEDQLSLITSLLDHRGPDGRGTWSNHSAGLAHTRLAVIAVDESGRQPMVSKSGNVISFNGEIYNYRSIRNCLKNKWEFQTSSDTESILAAYASNGADCLKDLRGMFAFAIWDSQKRSLFCARDRFGIKPFYYCIVGDLFVFASEMKALLPFLEQIRTNDSAFAEYLTFQYTIGEKTLFSGIKQLLPGHALRVENGSVDVWRYWDVHYHIDYDHSPAYFERSVEELVSQSIVAHLVSDVEIGSYVSGGVDSSLVHILANKNGTSPKAFHGRFVEFEGYDESEYARNAVKAANGQLFCLDIGPNDFLTNIESLVYHLDSPVAGPGSFPQYMVSELASKHVKVVLGGQGGDELFGGYARYLIAYLEQCINAALDGSYKNGNYVVTIESIIPNMGLLKEYKPLIKQFWSRGLFEPMENRYFSLVDRASDMQEEVNWEEINTDAVFESFVSIFNNENNVGKESYFDKMTHFDFKCLLPALLQVEDRVSMAHGLESRVPLLDHPLVEFAATIPADIKFNNGRMKHLLKEAFGTVLPSEITSRQDKMGFPVPLKEWFDGELKEFVMDHLMTSASRSRRFINGDAILKNFGKEARFSRKVWALLSLELWHQRFHDRAAEWQAMLPKP